MNVDKLSRMTLADAEGTQRRLAEYWADHPVVLVFLRHFG